MALSSTVSPHSVDESEEFIIYSSEEATESRTETPKCPLADADDMKNDSNPSNIHNNHSKPKSNPNLHASTIPKPPKLSNLTPFEELQYSLTVPPESRRTITITKIEERNRKKGISKKKYTVYTIHCDPPIIDGVNLTVCRRYNDFKWLRSILLQIFPAIFIPPIPRQQIMGRFKREFTEHRKRDLQRFLNRLAAVQCISESLIFTVFLSRPEDTFAVSKEEMERNHIPTINQKIHFLESVFPSISTTALTTNPKVTEYLNSNHIDFQTVEFRKNQTKNPEIEQYIKSADAIIFGSEIGECHEFLLRVRSSLNDLSEIAKRINDKLVALKQCTKRFHESFWRLHSKTNMLSDQCSLSGIDDLERFGTDQRDFYGWFSFNGSMQEIHSGIMCRNLKYQYDDISAFLDLFEDRNKLCSQFESVKSRIVRWQQLIDVEYEFQPHQMTQITMDLKQEKVLRRLLLLMTSVILQYDVRSLWGQLIEDWKLMMKEYAQQQLMAFQILYADMHQGDADEQEESLSIFAETEEYQYEPVFDENDSRRFSHGHLEKSDF